MQPPVEEGKKSPKENKKKPKLRLKEQEEGESYYDTRKKGRDIFSH